MSVESEFYDKYITSSEICSTVGITRAALSFAVKFDKFPAADIVLKEGIHIWKRDKVLLAVLDWRNRVLSRSK